MVVFKGPVQDHHFSLLLLFFGQAIFVVQSTVLTPWRDLGVGSGTSSTPTERRRLFLCPCLSKLLRVDAKIGDGETVVPPRKGIWVDRPRLEGSPRTVYFGLRPNSPLNLQWVCIRGTALSTGTQTEYGAVQRLRVRSRTTNNLLVICLVTHFSFLRSSLVM